MPSLNNLRTKGGVIVTIVIFIALIAFLIGDIFSSGSSMLNSRKMRVGEINGKNIGYVEFLNQSDYIGNVYKMMWGRDAMGSEEMEMIYNAAWEQLLMEYSYRPSFDKMGLAVSAAEQVDMIDGIYLSPVITQTFVNPNTGMFDPAFMHSFMMSVGEDDYAYTIWNFLKSQMVDNRAMTKYMTLIANGFHVTDFEVANAVKATNGSYDARVIMQPYSSVPDSLVKVSDSQIRSYYKQNKNKYKQSPSRDVEYVVFDVMPSESDYEDAAKYVEDLATEFKSSDSPMQYATLNSQERPDNNYYKEDQLTPQLAGIAFGRNAGKLYGPVLNGDTYTISRLADTKNEPDSIGAKHILLPRGEQALADSLARVIRRGGNFEEVAREYSIDQSVFMNGGDLGRFAPEQMIPEFSNAVIGANVREVVTTETQFGIHVIQVTHKARPVRKAQIATITYKVDPSAATMQDIYSRAANFVAAADGSAEGFRQAVIEESLSKRSVRIRNTDRTLSGLDNSKELIRWAYNNKKGAVSTILEIDGDYLVAALTDIREDEYTPVGQVASEIRRTLMNEAKATIIAEQMTGSSIDAIAADLNLEIQEADDVQLSAFYIPEFGVEPALIGAITTVEEDAISKPVKGMSGVYVFEVAKIVDAGVATAEGERARLEANAEYGANGALQAIYEESDVKDMRVKFF